MTRKRIFIGFILILAAIGIVINLDVIIPAIYPAAPVEQIETGLAMENERLTQGDIEIEWARVLELEREAEHQEQVKRIVESKVLLNE